MKSNGSFSLRARGASLNYALAGIRTFFKEEHNARIHLIATIAVVVVSFVLPVSRWEIIALTLSIGFVWVAEILNTAIEKTMDLISTEKDKRIKTIKDLSAAAVLLSAFVAVGIGCLIFIPKILAWIG